MNTIFIWFLLFPNLLHDFDIGFNSKHWVRAKSKDLLFLQYFVQIFFWQTEIRQNPIIMGKIKRVRLTTGPKGMWTNDGYLELKICNKPNKKDCCIIDYLYNFPPDEYRDITQGIY